MLNNKMKWYCLLIRFRVSNIFLKESYFKKIMNYCSLLEIYGINFNSKLENILMLTVLAKIYS